MRYNIVWMFKWLKLFGFIKAHNKVVNNASLDVFVDQWLSRVSLLTGNFKSVPVEPPFNEV